jgi:hypothetical protein
VYGNWVRDGQHATEGAEEEEAKKVGENDFTKALADTMQEALRGNDEATPRVLSEVHVKTTEPDMTGKVDILVQDRDESPVLS